MIRGYLRFRRAVFALFAVVLVIFPIVQAVYCQALEATGYAVLLLTFVLALFVCVDFLRYRERIGALDEVLKNLSEAAHALPEPVGPIETRYHSLGSGLYALLADQKESLTRAHEEQLDYYTVWVHQIKTPIAAMRLAMHSNARTEILEQELFKVERYVEMALQFAKLGDLSSDLIIREYKLLEIISASVKKYAPLFIGKKLSVSIEDVDRLVTTDSKWLSFILEQLLSNAVKYTNQGSIRIYCEGDALVVQDSGIGIRTEDIARIFEKGYTGYNGRLDKRASGLGLYMARRVADYLSIRIGAQSEVGKGTRMTLTFPKRDDFLQ